MKKVEADNQQRVLVDFNPAPELTHHIINNLNNMTTKVPPQEFATYLASYVSAFAFILHSNNSTKQVVKLFTELSEQAGRQFEHRKKLLEKEANNPLRFKP